MAYLGTPPRSRVLSSADIDPGSVSLDDISFTDQPASMNISGNIDKHTMRLADQVVVNGDLDVTDNLILSKISDDGNAIILTNDSSTRTIEGAGGSLEASTLTATPNSSLTGMTGEIGSAVTGTLGSNIVFPAGHILQTKYYTSTVANGTSTSDETTATAGISLGYVHITPLRAGSVILLTCSWSYNFSRTANFQCSRPWVGFKIGTGNQTGTFADLRMLFGGNTYDGVDDGSDDVYRQQTWSFIHLCSSSYSLGQTISYEQKIGSTRGSGSVDLPTMYVRNNSGNPASTMVVQEIAQ